MGTAISERERQVLVAVTEHLTNAEIALRLHISVRTVESHVASLLRKFEASDRRNLAAGAVGALAEWAAPRRGIVALPTALTSFVGRAPELEGLLRVLAESRLVTLVGPGGVGKTRLAVEAAVSVDASAWPDGGFVNLVPVGPDFVVQAVARVFEVGQRPDESLEGALVERLRAGRHLVVLDNCEHVLPAVAALARSIMVSCPQTTVLATSRQRLDLEGERVFSVSPLSLSGGGDGSGTAEAERLFIERSGALGGEDDDPALVAEVCRRVDGIPLAIELAVARRLSLGLEGLIAGIDDHLRLLSRTGHAHDRHSSLRLVIDWSHDLLGPDEKTLFRRLGVFQGEFDLRSAHAVAGWATLATTGDLVGRLADKSLLFRTYAGGHSRWRMLDTVRAYAREQLLASGDCDGVRDRHLEWAASEARALVDALESGVSWRERFDAVVDDLRSALAASSKGRSGFDLAMGLGHLTFARRYLAESRDHLRVAVDRAPDGTSAVDALRLAAGAAFSEMRGEPAYQLLMEAFDRASAGGDRRTAALVLADAAGLAGRAPALFNYRFELQEVVRLVAQARELAPPGDLEVETYLAIATAWSTTSGFANSQMEPANEALDRARSLDDPRLLSIALDAAATACAVKHQYRESARLTAERVGLLDRMPRHDPRLGGEIADIYHMANETAIATGRLDDALSMARRQVHDEATYGLAHFAANNLVIALALKGDFEEAIGQAEVMLAGWEQAGRPAAAWMGPPYYAAAMVYGLRGDQQNYAKWQGHALAVSAGGEASGFARYCDARVALHYGDMGRARQSSATESGGAYAPFAAYTSAVAAEVAVVTAAPDSETRLAALATFASENDFVAAHTARAAGLLHTDQRALRESVLLWEAIGARFERACTLSFVDGRAEEGRRELAALGCHLPVYKQ